MMRRPHSAAGFTLIEAIMVIVITGILASMVAVFITKPVEGYVDSVRRAELTDAADVALRRMTRDIRLALPNSLRTSGSCIEFIMTSAGGRYRDPADGSTGGDFLSFTSTGDTSFDALGAMPSNPAIAANDYIVVYNLGPGYNPGNAYNYDDTSCLAGGCNIAKIASISGNTIMLGANPFAAQSPPLPSPNSRFQVVPGSTKAVSYVCSGGRLRRYANYGFKAAQDCPPTGTPPATLVGSATTTAACSIEYTANATGRNGLIHIDLTLTDTPSNESVTLFQQIHVDNSP